MNAKKNKPYFDTVDTRVDFSELEKKVLSDWEKGGLVQKYLLKNKNRLICVAKLNRPKTRDPKHSLKPVVKRLQEYLPDYKIILIDDFLTCDQKIFKEQKENEILVLEKVANKVTT